MRLKSTYLFLFLLMLFGSISKSAENNDISSGKKTNYLAFWVLGESLVLSNCALARVSPTAVGAINLLGLALSNPNGKSGPARASHYGLYIALSGYDFYAEKHVPHNRMFWQQFIGLHIAVLTPAIIDHFLGFKSNSTEEAKNWDIRVAVDPDRANLNFDYHFNTGRINET